MNPQNVIQSVMKVVAIAIFPVAGVLMFGHDIAWIGLLLVAPPAASLGWRNSAGLVAVGVSFFILGAASLMFASSIGAWVAALAVIVLGVSFLWICHRFLVRETMTLHTERQVIEDLEDEIVLLRQETETCEKGILQNQNRQKKYSLLNEAAYRLGTSLQLAEVAEYTLGQIIGLLGDRPASFTFFLFNKEGQEIMRLSHDTGAGLSFSKDLKCDGDDINRWALQRGTPLIIRNIERDFRFKGLDLATLKGRSFLVSPLILEGRVNGLVRVEGAREELFDTEDQRLLEGFLGMAQLALENAKLFRETEELAITDGLTKLYLRRTLMERLEEELARSRRETLPLAVVLLDIDHFKKVNDSHGHPAGDQVLRIMASVMKQNVRDVDLCGRYGGEEFAVALPATSVAGAMKVAERIREAVEAQAFTLGGQPAKLTVSLGVSCFPENGQTLEVLIKAADQALYVSKQNGRNQVSLASQVPQEGA
jgi:diguanylate cyclase (GGDEF)-like protein